MRKSWRDIKNQTMTQRQQVQAHALALRDLREMELRELREALKVTQVTLARRLKITQAAVSRLEKRSHMFVNTLGDYVEALGGKIEVHAVLPDRTISLAHFFHNKTGSARARKRTAARRPVRKRELVRA